LRQNGSQGSTPATSTDDVEQSSDDPDTLQDKTESLSVSDVLSWSGDILWVLTVPAIWSDEAKQFMREAAIQVPVPVQFTTHCHL
jgi:hypothetical protein